MTKFILPQAAEKIITLFQKNNFECYAVGGPVRDLLLGRPVKNIDFTTNATPEEIQKLLAESFYDNKFGTVGITLSHLYQQFGISGIPAEEEIYEITTFRTENSYSDRRHPDNISWGKTLEEDVERRDFTINAMALTMKTNNLLPITNNYKKIGDYYLYDYFGGQTDLQNKIIRAVGNPNERFNEDALRMMRTIRFSSELGFAIEEKTLQAITDNAKLLLNISWERIRDELLKILKSPFPYEGFVFLHQTKLLNEILPELEDCFPVSQKSPNRHHIYDVGNHSLMSLKYCPSSDPIVRLATLLHDIGKAKTVSKLPNGTVTFYNHEVFSARLSKKIADRLRLSNEQKEKLWTLVRWHQFSVDEHQTDSAIRRFIKRVGVNNISNIVDLRIGDRLGGGLQTATSWRLQLYLKKIINVQKHTPSVKDLKVNGNDVMRVLGIKPGPKVGEILEKLFKEITEDPQKNEREYLLERITKLNWSN